MKTNTQFKMPLVVVSIIFFMWGFLTCLNDILIPHLKGVFSLSYTQSALIQFTFFGAYFLVSLPAGRIVSRLGYKNSIALGLLIAAIGTAAFYPSASIQSYPSFLGALFVLASGITILQVAANPYVSLLGSSETAASRLNLAQALNALGTTVAPYFGSLLILAAVTTSPEQLAQMSPEQLSAHNLQQATSVQMPYLILTAALLLLALFIYFFKLPQVSSAQTVDQNQSSYGSLLNNKHLLFGVIGIFVYVGAEVSVGSFLINFLSLPHIGNMTEQQAAHFVPYYWGGAMIGRFFGSALMRKIDAGKLLGIAATAAVALLAVTLTSQGAVAMWSVVLVGLFNSIMFPTIFSLSIRGLGPQTEKASSLLIMAIVGGAIIPMIHGSMADQLGLQVAFVLPLLCYVYVAFFGFKGSRAS